MTSQARLDPVTAVGPVVLAAADTDRLAAWYRAALGLADLGRDGDAVVLGTGDGTPLFVLVARPGAIRPVRGEPGLYHAAVLLPDRAALGAFLRHAAARGIRIDGAADHLVSEAVYLTDPEGNGIEVYRDRPRAEWPLVDGRLRMDNARLDVEGILAAGDAAGARFDTAPAGTVMGHVHLKVADLAAARAFYIDALGFEATEESYPSALFVAAGGYHHHLGLNVWESRSGRRSPGRTGLVAATIVTEPASLAALRARLLAAGHSAADRAGMLVAVDPAGNDIAVADRAIGAAEALGLGRALADGLRLPA